MRFHTGRVCVRDRRPLERSVPRPARVTPGGYPGGCGGSRSGRMVRGRLAASFPRHCATSFLEMRRTSRSALAGSISRRPRDHRHRETGIAGRSAAEASSRATVRPCLMCQRGRIDLLPKPRTRRPVCQEVVQGASDNPPVAIRPAAPLGSPLPSPRRPEMKQASLGVEHDHGVRFVQSCPRSRCLPHRSGCFRPIPRWRAHSRPECCCWYRRSNGRWQMPARPIPRS